MQKKRPARSWKDLFFFCSISGRRRYDSWSGSSLVIFRFFSWLWRGFHPGDMPRLYHPPSSKLPPPEIKGFRSTIFLKREIHWVVPIFRISTTSTPGKVCRFPLNPYPIPATAPMPEAWWKAKPKACSYAGQTNCGNGASSTKMGSSQN